MNTYKIMKEKHQNEVNAFPMAFAFSQKQFEEGMQKLGLNPTDTDKIYKLHSTGGFYRRSDAKLLREMFDRNEKETAGAIENDKTGDGFIFEMFDYELGNYEYVITCSTENTLDALGMTEEEVNSNPALLHGLQKACNAQKEWYILNG
jgi:hypothetical protein